MSNIIKIRNTNISPLFGGEIETAIQNNEADIIEQLLSNYEVLLYKATDRVSTCRQYIKTVKLFLGHLEEYGFTLDVVEGYKKALDRNGMRGGTGNGYLSSAKALLKQAKRERIIPQQVAIETVENFKQESGHKKDGLKQDEVKEILSYIPTIRIERRRLTVAAMVQLLAFAGLRQKELIGLKVKDVDMKNGKIWVTGKGSDDKQAVPVLRESVKEAIQELIEYRNLGADDYLFSQLHDKKAAVSAAYVRKLFTNPTSGVFGRAGVEQGSVHGFRHFFVSFLVSKGFDVTEIAPLSRHKSLQALKSYVDSYLNEKTAAKAKGLFEGF